MSSLGRFSRGIIAGSALVLAITVGSGDALASQLSLSWVDNSGGQVGFSVERAPSVTGPFGEVARTAVGVPTYVDTMVAGGTAYCYRVRAITPEISAYSNVACATAGSQVSPVIANFYASVLDRTPSPNEAAPWVGFLGSNCSAGGMQAVANAFFGSQEFRTLRPMTLAGLVTAVYGALLGRSPDPGGLSGWIGALREQRIDVATNFITSTEFQRLVPDRSNASIVSPLMTRFYTAILGRAPDPAGLQSWVNYVVMSHDLEGAAVTFLTSAEFEARALTARDYVEILYLAFLGREPDPSGWDGWERAVLGDLLATIDGGFVPSAEFQSRISRVCGG